MNTNKIFVALFLALSFVSCKNEETKKSEEIKNSEEGKAKVSNLFTFTLNVTVKQDDDFQLFYKEESGPEIPFEEAKSVWSGVKGSETAQDIVFSLPEGVLPTQLRLDFGQNKKQPEIIVNNFKASYNDKSFSISGKDFFNYFIPDENFVKIDKEAQKVIPVTGTAYDPMFFSTADYNTEMTKLAK
ncbi:MAG TPA: hypothetical protein VFR70_00585 [Flavobacterium sp.]|nr:hypothetical protein [Flavobacterium sp.]